MRWYIRSVSAPLPETAINLWRSFAAWVTRTEPPWIIEAREAAEEAVAEEHEARVSETSATDLGTFNPLTAQRPRRSQARTQAGSRDGVSRSEAMLAEAAGGWNDAGSTSSSEDSALALQRYKRIITATGIIGTYITWALFTWCVPASRMPCYLLVLSSTLTLRSAAHRVIFACACCACCLACSR